VEAAIDIFERQRGRLMALAYGFLGSHSEAEDVVQEAWLRYQAAEGLRKPEAWLATVVSRIALDRLGSAQRRREMYPGTWLPEPVSELPDPESTQAIRSLLSLGFLHLLEMLGPEERAVVVLREAFERSYEDIAEVIGKSAAACRQLFSRAMKRLKREHAGPVATVPESVVQQFIEALASEDEQRLLGLLADDAILFSDGGGRVRAAVNPIYGSDKIARFFFGILRKNGPGYSVRIGRANGEPALLAFGDGHPAVLAFSFDGSRVTGLHLISNPEKLRPFEGLIQPAEPPPDSRMRPGALE
jgi:RNA polymerase sigma-70 factor (ECF subfamily)